MSYLINFTSDIRLVALSTLNIQLDTPKKENYIH